jgi:hypothetical protein
MFATMYIIWTQIQTTKLYAGLSDAMPGMI